MDQIAAALEIVLSAALMAAAAGKLLSWSHWLRSRDDLRVNIPYALWIGLPVVECVLALALAVGLRPWAAGGSALLFFLFVITLAVSVRRGAQGDCNCLGELVPMRIGLAAVLRALAFVSLAGAVLLLEDVGQPPHLAGLAVSGGIAALVMLVSELRAAGIIWPGRT